MGLLRFGVDQNGRLRKKSHFRVAAAFATLYKAVTIHSENCQKQTINNFKLLKTFGIVII
jgi:hypothetical protein